MTEFKTAEELMDHYKSLKSRLMPTRPTVVTILPPPPPPQPKTPPKELPPPPTTRIVIPKLPAVSPAIKPVHVKLNDQGVYEGKIAWADVIALVIGWSHMSLGEIFCRRRDKKSAKVRQLLWALSVKHCTHLSTPKIGRLSKSFSEDDGYDHSTVIHGAKQGRKMPEFPALDQQLIDLKNERTLEALKEACKQHLLT